MKILEMFRKKEKIGVEVRKMEAYLGRPVSHRELPRLRKAIDRANREGEKMRGAK